MGSFDFTSGMQGSTEGWTQGSSFGGPWGGVAGAVVGFIAGGYFGGKAKKKAAKAKQKQAIAFAEWMKMQKFKRGVMEDQYKLYQEEYEPVERQLGEAVRTGSFGAPKEMVDQYQQKASANVMASFSKAREMNKRKQASVGVDPSSGAAMANDARGYNQQAGAEASEMTRAGQKAEGDLWTRRYQFANMGKQMPGQTFDQANVVQAGYKDEYSKHVGDEQAAYREAAEKTQAFMPPSGSTAMGGGGGMMGGFGMRDGGATTNGTGGDGEYNDGG